MRRAPSPSPSPRGRGDSIVDVGADVLHFGPGYEVDLRCTRHWGSPLPRGKRARVRAATGGPASHHMAGGKMPRLDLAKLGLDVGADLLRQRAPGAEAAAGGR